MNRPKLILVLAALLLLGVAATGWTQESATSTPEGALTEEVVAEIRTDTTFWGLVRQGGWTMVPLGLLSVGAIGLTIYGFIAVQTAKMLRPDLVPQLQDDLVNLRLDEAKTTCTSAPCLLTNTLSAGLERISDGVLDVESMEKAMEEASVQETTVGMKPINYLSIIAQIAPMLGLLGTVSGMIKAFQKIGLGGMGRPEVLAENIGEAMVTTATGLIIGIPAMFFYFFLKSKYMTNVSQLGRILGNLSHHLVASSRRAANGEPPALYAAASGGGSMADRELEPEEA